MDNEVRVVTFGLGPLGAAIAKGISDKKGMKIVGAVDTAKDLIGRDLGQILNMGRNLGVTIVDDGRDLIPRVKPDIAIISTRSSVRDIYSVLTLCIEAGVDVISTCEELSYPYYRYPQLATEIDSLAKQHGVTVLGTGINPGYLMDVLPIILTGACLRVDSIKVTRMMDSSKRRIPFQKKIGPGLTPEQFADMIREKKITGHVGLLESTAMTAAARMETRWNNRISAGTCLSHQGNSNPLYDRQTEPRHRPQERGAWNQRWEACHSHGILCTRWRRRRIRRRFDRGPPEGEPKNLGRRPR